MSPPQTSRGRGSADAETEAYVRTLQTQVERLARRLRAVEPPPARTSTGPIHLILPAGPVRQRTYAYGEVLAQAVAAGEIDDRWDGADPPPIEPFPGWTAISRAGTRTVRLGYDMRRVPAGQVARLVDRIAESVESTDGFLPVFIHRCEDLSAFRRHGFLVEVIPDLPGLDPSGTISREAYEAFVGRRLAFITRKYGLAGILEPGRRPEGDGAPGQACSSSVSQ